jgi:flagellar biosynthetic protein FlhB
MADDDDKTEEPTDRKLRKAKEEGNVPKSEELTGFVSLVLDIIMIYVIFKFYADEFKQKMGLCINSIFLQENVKNFITDKCGSYIELTTFLVIFTLAFGVLGGFLGYFMMHQGFVLPKDPIKLNINAFNIGNNLSNLINMQAAVGTVVTIIKETLYYSVFFALLIYFIPLLVYETFCYQNCQGVTPIYFILYLVIAYTVIALIFVSIDVPLKIKFWKDKLKMSHKDLKDEHKEMEGAPEIKRAQNQFRHDLLQGPAIGAKNATFFVRGAGVILGIRYNRAESPAPIVVVIGKTPERATQVGQVAQNMRRLVIQDEEFMRQLIKMAVPGRAVPLEFVKEIRRCVMELRKHEQQFGPVHPAK